GISQSLHPAMIDIAAPVKQDALDAFIDGALCYGFADGLSRRDVAAILHRPLRLGFERRRRDDGFALGVVYDLRVDVLVTAEYAKTRTFFASAEPLTNPVVNSQPDHVGIEFRHGYFAPPAFPAFFLRRSFV